MCGVKRSCFIYIFIQIFSGDERQIKRLKMLKNAVWKQEKKKLTFLSLLGKPKKRIASGNLSVILQSASCSCFCMFLLLWEPGQGGKGDAGTPCVPAAPSWAHGAGAREQPAAVPARWGMELAEARADIPGQCFEAGCVLVLSVIKDRS